MTPIEKSAPFATVLIPKDQTAGLSKITTLDGQEIDFDDHLNLSAGVHVLGIACPLDNGVG